MRRFKVKTKIAAWLTLLIGILTLMLLGFLLSVSGRVAQSNASRQLSNTCLLYTSGKRCPDLLGVKGV